MRTDKGGRRGWTSSAATRWRTGASRIRVRDIGIGSIMANPTIFEHAIESGADYDAQIGLAGGLARLAR